MFKLGDVLNKTVQLKYITDGGLGAKPPAAGGYGVLRAKPLRWEIFCNFLEKKLFYCLIGSQFARVQSRLIELKLYHLKAN